MRKYVAPWLLRRMDMITRKVPTSPSSVLNRYFVNVTRTVPAIYQQIGMVVVWAADPESALERVRSGLGSGELSPEWVTPEQETIGVELAPGEPGPTIIDIPEAFPYGEPTMESGAKGGQQ